MKTIHEMRKQTSEGQKSASPLPIFLGAVIAFDYERDRVHVAFSDNKTQIAAEPAPPDDGLNTGGVIVTSPATFISAGGGTVRARRRWRDGTTACASEARTDE